MRNNNKSSNSLEKSLKEQHVILNDERFIHINEKTSHSVSKIMNWLLLALLFITGAIMKEYLALTIISAIIIIKFTLTLIYYYHYNHNL